MRRKPVNLRRFRRVPRDEIAKYFESLADVVDVVQYRVEYNFVDEWQRKRQDLGKVFVGGEVVAEIEFLGVVSRRGSVERTMDAYGAVENSRYREMFEDEDPVRSFVFDLVTTSKWIVTSKYCLYHFEKNVGELVNNYLGRDRLEIQIQKLNKVSSYLIDHTVLQIQ